MLVTRTTLGIAESFPAGTTPVNTKRICSMGCHAHPSRGARSERRQPDAGGRPRRRRALEGDRRSADVAWISARDATRAPVSRTFLQTRSRFWTSRGIGGLKVARTDTNIDRLWDNSNVQDGSTGLLNAYMQNPTGVDYAASGSTFAARAAYVNNTVREFFPEIDDEYVGGVEKIWQNDPYVKGGWAWFAGDEALMFPAASDRKGSSTSAASTPLLGLAGCKVRSSLRTASWARSQASPTYTNYEVHTQNQRLGRGCQAPAGLVSPFPRCTSAGVAIAVKTLPAADCQRAAPDRQSIHAPITRHKAQFSPAPHPVVRARVRRRRRGDRRPDRWVA